MATNEIYLMSPIFDETALAYCQALDQVPKNEDVTTIMNCPGGSVFAGWTIIGRLQEREGKNNAKVYGLAASMAAYFLFYCDNVEALDVTSIMIHRASGYIENEDDQKNLDRINADLRKHMEAKMDMEAFTKITGLTMDDVFKGDKVKDVWLTAKDAKKIGIVNKIIRLAPEELKAYNEKFVALKTTQGRAVDPQAGGSGANVNNNNQIKTKMTAQELKTQHPEAYAEIFALGEKAGVKAEQTRVNCWMPFLEVDKENVIKAIKEGKEFTPDVNSEMIVKITAGKTVESIKKDSAGNIITEQTVDKTQQQKEIDAFAAEVKKGVNPKSKVL